MQSATPATSSLQFTDRSTKTDREFLNKLTEKLMLQMIKLLQRLSPPPVLVLVQDSMELAVATVAAAAACLVERYECITITSGSQTTGIENWELALSSDQIEPR